VPNTKTVLVPNFRMDDMWRRDGSFVIADNRHQ